MTKKTFFGHALHQRKNPNPNPNPKLIRNTLKSTFLKIRLPLDLNQTATLWSEMKKEVHMPKAKGRGGHQMMRITHMVFKKRE